jgi:hypothetical protein
MWRRHVPGGSIGGSLAIGLAAAALMPLHEGLVFFLPLLFVLLELGRPVEGPRRVLLRFAATVLPSAIAVAAILAASGAIQTGPLFAAVPEYGPGMAAWCQARGIGSICWLGFPTDFVVGYVYRIGYAGFWQAFALVALQAALVTAVYVRVRGRPMDVRTGALLAIGWIGVLPLFLVAFDWGRWEAAITMLFVLLAPLGPAVRRRRAGTLLGAAAVLSVFTVSHMQSVSFEAGGPLLLKRGLEAAAALVAAPG